MRAIAFVLMTFGLFAGCASRPPVNTVSEVDVGRYAGRWYEIAKYPNWFQRNCVGETTATYTPLSDGSLKVVNSCRRKDGKLDRVTGRATIVPDSGNAKLKVSFFGPFTGDYWIIGLDQKGYQWAVVGHPSRKYLWVLSRTPHMTEENYAKAVKIATGLGYDASRIVRTSQ